jgi:hypothetical protein
MTKHTAGTQPVELGSAVVIATLMAACEQQPCSGTGDHRSQQVECVRSSELCR